MICCTHSAIAVFQRFLIFSVENYLVILSFCDYIVATRRAKNILCVFIQIHLIRYPESPWPVRRAQGALAGLPEPFCRTSLRRDTSPRTEDHPPPAVPACAEALRETGQDHARLAGLRVQQVIGRCMGVTGDWTL